MRSTPMRAANARKSGSKIEITVNAAGRQSMSPPASPSKQDKVGSLSVTGAGVRHQDNHFPSAHLCCRLQS